MEFLEGVTALEKKVILDEVHSYRGDTSAYMIRSSMTRVRYKDEDFPAHQTDAIKKGDILICNNEFGQYKGETQIALKEMKNDGTRNIDVVKATPHKKTIVDPFTGNKSASKGKERTTVNPDVTSEIKEDLRPIEEAFTKGQQEMLHNIVEHHMPVDRQMIFMGYETVGEMKVFLIKNRDLLPEAYRQLKILFQIKEEEL